MANHWDIVVYNREDRLQLAVEVSNRHKTSAEYVTEWKENIFSHSDDSELPYFMMAFPDRFYLWRNFGERSSILGAPDYVVDARPLLQPYFERTGIEPESVGSSSLELIISSWLSRVIHYEGDVEALPDWLVESGLFDAVADGRFSFEVVA